MNYIIISFIGYLIGSFPTAYVFMKKARGLDITELGSGNVGTLNAYEISKSRSIGLFVLIIDLIKGILCIYFARLLFPAKFIYCALALLFAVFAHCFSPWVKFKGGRGLATAAGGFLLLSPFVLFSWIIFWTVAQAIKKNVHFSNFFATILTLLFVITSSNFLIRYSNPPAESSFEYITLVLLILISIIIKHTEPLKEYFRNNKVFERVNSNEKT